MDEQPAPLKGHWMTTVLPLSAMLMIAGVMAALMVMPVPEPNAARFDLILGFILGAASSGVTYWLGSSRGSAEKSATMARTGTPPAPPRPDDDTISPPKET